MITPRITRLLRAPDLRAFQHAIAALIPRGCEARQVAVLVPSRGAAAELRRTLEDALLEDAEAFVLPDVLTRNELYARLHEGLPEAPPRLDDFEREVLLRLAAEGAEAGGAPAPFRLKPGLLSAILSFYDELRRRGRSVDSFDRNLRERLEPGSETDRGADRLLKGTAFLSAAFAAFERLVADSGRIDEHALRDLLLSHGTGMTAAAASARYAHAIVTVGDQAADSEGLWPADFDLLARLPALRRLDVVATERVLAAGLHGRLLDALPGLEEHHVGHGGPPPVLLAPDAERAAEPLSYFVPRDREEELVEAARWVKARGRTSPAATPPRLDRTAIVFGRPLPYLYLARQVFPSASVPYQTLDALPLASEPFAAALDLVLTAAAEEGTRTALVELLRSTHWSFVDAAPGPADGVPRLDHVAAFDRILHEAKYLGGWGRLEELAGAAVERAGSAARDGTRYRRAQPAFAAALTIAEGVRGFEVATSASGQLDALLRFIRRHERPLPIPFATSEHGNADPGAPDDLAAASDEWRERHGRARAAILGALAGLRDAHARYDDRPLLLGDLIATIRRWIESQTFAPRRGRDGVLLLDAAAAAYTTADAVRLVGLVESDWPERGGGSIFYPLSLLRDLGWPPESERLAAARARFEDLVLLAREEVSISAFTLEEDALVSPSSFVEEVASLGLPVRRLPRTTPPRIFIHEALTTQPIVVDTVAGGVRASLERRLARSDREDPRFHGSTGARPAAVYAVSRVERYLDCPFKYFAGHVLQLEEEREDESGLTPQERGQLLHGVFERFFVRWRDAGGGTITAENLDEALALFQEVADAQLASLPEADRALERTYLLGSAASPGLAERAFGFEVDQGFEVLERLLEQPLEGTFTFDGGEGARPVHVRGKADRIDLLADGTFRIIDYKLGRAPKPSRALQLPIYGVCAEAHLEGRLGRRWSLGRAGYVAFREKNAFVDLAGRSGNLAAALQDGQRRFLGAVRRIEAGEFPPSPDEPWTCTRCGFAHVCRKDYVGDE